MNVQCQLFYLKSVLSKRYNKNYRRLWPLDLKNKVQMSVNIVYFHCEGVSYNRTISMRLMERGYTKDYCFLHSFRVATSSTVVIDKIAILY